MADECRPPDGTPDGTLCWLRTRYMWEPAVWWTNPDGWELLGHEQLRPPQHLEMMGWRFHSIAVPPDA
jgi:hypothetical protein